MKIKVILKIAVFMILIIGVKLLYSSFASKAVVVETPIDKAWWDDLSEHWKTIFLINQNFSKQHTDIYAVQKGYVNRMNTESENDNSEMNRSLHDLNDKRMFGLSYYYFYARALKYKFVKANDSIDLATLSDLDIIYMVNGPGDLTPLKKFPNLKILILNFCGVPNAIRTPALDLEPVRGLKELQVLECNAHLIHSIEPIKNLTALRELRIESSEVTDISPLKKLINLEVLTVRTKAKSGAVISNLINLKELYISDFKNVPNLSKLTKLKSLSISESEMAIVDGSYRIQSLEFLSTLGKLEYLDLDNTSYRGNLDYLANLQHLKAVTLPGVSRDNVRKFKDQHKDCFIINSYEFE